MASNLRTTPVVLHRLLENISVRSLGQRRNFMKSVRLQSEEIVVPKRIPRSPTDILQALASTVKRDHSGPHYKYHDDPYLTPASNLVKRSYSLSKEAGRKAARWIRDENPHLFSHIPEDPVIEAFAPKVQYNEENDVSEDTLRDLVKRSQVSDVMTVYQICKDKGIELSDNVKQEVLELVCYYNGEPALEDDWVEERWYRQAGNTIRKTWKDNGVAEEIFDSMNEKSPAAYCALVRGMTQYYQVDRAWKLYNECCEKEIPLDTNTYNSLISVSTFMRDAPDLRWQLVKDLLTSMATAGVLPNLGTLNSTLEALNQLGSWQRARELSLQVFREFYDLGIRPCLATYYYLLIIHCRERGPISHILLDILDKIEGSEFQVQHLKDTFFFVTAMDVARNHLKSLEVAQRVDRVLNTGDNHNFIGDSYKESVYYRHYFALSCSMMPMDQLMEMYMDLVPHIYTPEPGIMEEIVKAVILHEAFEHLPQLFSDMIIFEHTYREKLLALVLSATAQYTPSEDNRNLTERIKAIATDIWKRVQEQEEVRRSKIVWTGQMLGDVLTTVVKSGDYQHGVEVLTEATKQAHTIIGALPASALKVLLDAAIERADTNIGMNIVLYGQDSGHQETGEMALCLRSSLTLTAQQNAKLTDALGLDIMADDLSSSESDSNDEK